MNRKEAIEQAAQAIKQADITGYPDCKPLPISTYRAYAKAALEALAMPKNSETSDTDYAVVPALIIEAVLSKYEEKS